jgi:hypothetical protein
MPLSDILKHFPLYTGTCSPIQNNAQKSEATFVSCNVPFFCNFVTHCDNDTKTTMTTTTTAAAAAAAFRGKAQLAFVLFTKGS